MTNVTRIGISLPAALLEDIDRMASARGLSRSEAFRRAAGAWLQSAAERDAADRYLAGYRAHPDSRGDVTMARRAAAAALAGEPWE